MRVLVTGASGFVGRYLLEHLKSRGDEVLEPERFVDVVNGDALKKQVTGLQPDGILHLAALSHVGESWKRPDDYLQVNVVGTHNLLQAARECDPMPRVLIISSSEVYGRAGGSSGCITEETPMCPVSPYAATKAAAEMLAIQAWQGWGLPVVRARPFNHIGPGQPPDFVVPALARRIVQASLQGESVLRTGNLWPKRDFTDVLDVVKAYRLLLEVGEPGTAYNVASGHAISIGELAQLLISLARVDMEVVEDPALVRPVEVPVVCGDMQRILRATGWKPEIPLEDTLTRVLDWVRRELVRGPTVES
jgi:GDP-4-dehydro-6-deoxy-D-mannose reductase